MIQWYSHAAVLNEEIAEAKADLAAAISRTPSTRAFLELEVKYLELVKHRSLAEGDSLAIAGIDTALARLKELIPLPKSKENEDA